jgi:hypothetical protein
MKRLIIAVGLIALGVTGAAAQAPSDQRRERGEGDGRRSEGGSRSDGGNQARPNTQRRDPVAPQVNRPTQPPVARPQPPSPPVFRPQPPAPPVFRPQPPERRDYRPDSRRPGDGRFERRRPPVVFLPAPSFPSWSRSSYPYESRYHDTCQRKAWRLRSFERHASADGYLSEDEQDEIRSLRRDLRRTCGDFRWRG